ncbi:hypothetical protein SLEP1_g24894 [Rubroshorea leprosula]|uniref:Uncharacterized protein n=1 Tax=Rubroshorea leprosula TaxID=152421 RepID=A0AAV5JT76_9ROSI|nr:hypothetical protein SLEP1_g24894 [Rubroshorea leprosula]
MSMIPKGGETIWVGLDWSPERGFNCAGKRLKNNYTHNQNANESFANTQNVNYGRIISFGKDVAELHSSKFESVNFRLGLGCSHVIVYYQQNAVKGNEVANSSRCEVWTEYHEMGFEGIRAVADNKVYTAESILDLLHFVAPNLMAGGGAQFSHGIVDNLDDPKKRAYVYKLTPAAECYILFQIDTSAEGGNEHSCLKGGVFSTDGDETGVFSCTPANLLEGRGTQSGAHVDIMGNFALIEDIIRVAAGATGEDLGGDQVYSNIFEWSEKINLQLQFN